MVEEEHCLWAGVEEVEEQQLSTLGEVEGGRAGRGSTGSRTGAVLSTVPGNVMPHITTRPSIPLGLLSSVVRASDPRLGEG